MSELISVTICDGKYTVREHAPHKWEALRHGEHWPAMASGPDNLHVALAVEVDALRSGMSILKEYWRGQYFEGVTYQDKERIDMAFALLPKEPD